MARRALVDSTTVLDWAPESQGVDPYDLARCIDAASWWIETQTGCLLSSNEIKAWHSGAKAAPSTGPGGVLDTIYLQDPATGLVTRPVLSTPPMTVTEDGDALTVQYVDAATSWTDGELALVDPISGRLLRACATSGSLTLKAWSPGTGNIRVEYKAGYNTDTTAPVVPPSLRQLAIEASWLMYREGARNGLESLAETGVNLTFVRLLSPAAQKTLDSFRALPAPRTLLT